MRSLESGQKRSELLVAVTLGSAPFHDLRRVPFLDAVKYQRRVAVNDADLQQVSKEALENDDVVVARAHLPFKCGQLLHIRRQMQPCDLPDAFGGQVQPILPLQIALKAAQETSILRDGRWPHFLCGQMRLKKLDGRFQMAPPFTETANPRLFGCAGTKEKRPCVTAACREVVTSCSGMDART